MFREGYETIRGHVFCSFLALVLKKELDKQLEIHGMEHEWKDIERDITALQGIVKTIIFDTQIQRKELEEKSLSLGGHSARAHGVLRGTVCPAPVIKYKPFPAGG